MRSAVGDRYWSSRVLRPLPERLGGYSRHGSRVPRGTFRVGEDALPFRQYVLQVFCLEEKIYDVHVCLPDPLDPSFRIVLPNCELVDRNNHT